MSIRNDAGPRLLILAISGVLVCGSLSGCRTLDPRRPFERAEQVVSERLRFDSGVPAGVARDEVRGEMHFKVFRVSPKERGKRRLDVCVLQHGFGVAQPLLDFKRLTYDLFVRTYFGRPTVERLLAGVCENVYVSMQESNQTSILEMTRRTEVFLRDIACLKRGEREPSCAFVGHSKGGAVAFAMARRCMQRTSLLGERGCRRMREFYSATGVIQGALGAVVAHGAALTRNSEQQKLFTKVLGWGMDLVWNIYAQYVPGKSNPVWVDLSPAAPMEAGLPLLVAHDVVLRRSGWLTADFAATAVDFTFNDRGDSKLYGCGPKERADVLNHKSCRAFGATVGALHSAELRSSFEAGLAALKRRLLEFERAATAPKGNRAGSDKGARKASSARSSGALGWKEYQRSDGLADRYLAINACQRGLALKRDRVVRSCTVFRDLNHLATAGGGPAALADLIRELSR